MRLPPAMRRLSFSMPERPPTPTAHRQMTPEEMAELHKDTFPERPWAADAFAELLHQPNIFCHTDPEKRGMILARAISSEAEILTLATHPAHRRHGIARTLVCELVRACAGKNVRELFLEVAADNTAALGLYISLDFQVVGRRKGYYPRAGQSPVDAVIMRRALTQSQPD